MFWSDFEEKMGVRGEAGWADLGPECGRTKSDFKFVIGPEPAWKNVCYGSRGWKNMCLLVLLVFPPSRGSGDNGSIFFFLIFVFDFENYFGRIFEPILDSEAASALQGGSQILTKDFQLAQTL